MTAHAGRKLVLLIEDDAPMAARIGKILSADALLAVESVGGGLEGLGRLRLDPKPDLILLDLLLPDVDGYSVFEELRKNKSFPAVPVIVVTSASLVDDDLLDGSLATLRKPRMDGDWSAFARELERLVAKALHSA